MSYRLPKTVGMNQIAYSEAWPYPRHGGVLDQFTTKELFDELSSYGINALRLWLSVPYDDGYSGPPVYEDMHEVWEHPGIDTLVVIFKHPHEESFIEPGCHSDRVTTDNLNEPTYEIATFLYENIGHLNKTIIFTAPEIDNMARGYDCEGADEALWWDWDRSEECRAEKTDEECAFEMYEERMAVLIANAERRQREVRRARDEHPDANLVVATSITVSVFDEEPEYYNKFALRDNIPDMDPSPDYIGLSQGASGGRDFAFPIMQTMLFTGFPTDRQFVDQVYVNEEYPGKQYNLVKPAIEVAFNWDIQTVLIWMWKQGWRSYNEDNTPHGNKGMWQWANDPEVPGKTVYGDPTSGFQVVEELHPAFTTHTPTPEFTNTPTETPTPEPTATPEATPTPDDPCAECPAPGSYWCEMAPAACIQCWNECGQPYVTPTPVPPTPTPTPEPGDCSHCPPPGSIGCIISYTACEQCWSDCGSPLATPTPRDTPTPTPTPVPPTVATISMGTIEGSPSHCTWVATHQGSGFQVSKDFPDCSKDIQATFNQVGWWSMELTVHYPHGYSGVDDPCKDQEGTVCGDLDGDGLYEFRTFQMVEVIEEPEVPLES
jgi:hypothetical protein